MYHRIGTADPAAPAITHALTVRTADFAAQMAWLRRHGFHSVTQRELFDAVLGGRRLRPRAILITFDDGYVDVLTRAAPVLQRHGLSATAYVISGRLSAGAPFLSCGQVRALERRGVEIGSHTVSHRDLTTLSAAHAKAQLAG